jgi:hypothetical protein
MTSAVRGPPGGRRRSASRCGRNAIDAELAAGAWLRCAHCSMARIRRFRAAATPPATPPPQGCCCSSDGVGASATPGMCSHPATRQPPDQPPRCSTPRGRRVRARAAWRRGPDPTRSALTERPCSYALAERFRRSGRENGSRSCRRHPLLRSSPALPPGACAVAGTTSADADPGSRVRQADTRRFSGVWRPGRPPRRVPSLTLGPSGHVRWVRQQVRTHPGEASLTHVLTPSTGRFGASRSMPPHLPHSAFPTSRRGGTRWEAGGRSPNTPVVSSPPVQGFCVRPRQGRGSSLTGIVAGHPREVGQGSA